MAKVWEWASVTLGSAGVAALVLSLLLVPAGAAKGQSEDPELGIVDCALCGGTCRSPFPPCTGYCTGFLCPLWCGCGFHPVLGCVCR